MSDWQRIAFTVSAIAVGHLIGYALAYWHDRRNSGPSHRRWNAVRGAEPCDFETMQNGERFQARALNGGWQVYGAELEHIAMCDRPEYADMIAKALNDAASQKLDILGKSDVKWFSGNLHYSITGEGIKPRPVDCD